MSRLGKCQNYSGCLLAYRGEETEVPDGQPFVCAECGKALIEVKPSAGKRIMLAGVGVLLIAGIAAAVVFWPKIKERVEKKPGTPTTSTTPGTSAPPSTSATPGRGATIASSTAAPVRMTPEPVPVPNPDKVGDAEPPPVVKGEVKINLSVDPKVKAEVLKRIDLMPNITPMNKDKLYNSVERARKMGLVVTVPFGKGKTALAPADIQALKTELERPELASLRSDPTAVFVILGYADPKGDAKMNLGYSQTRADVVVAAMKHECGVLNVVHAVAMGGSTLLDAQNLEKNRIAEVWVVLP
ncbi:MAG: hypothetical protein QOE70_6078 [Chthoniobacter sp.]|jgi:outer membrane protein OmpA-like peptidoglycan-associated protein|nr:hypothetical protein [Chthoniobacter sp.]